MLGSLIERGSHRQNDYIFPLNIYSDNLDGASESEVTTLCLDTEIIPAKFGRALLHAMYTDVLDMRLVRDGDQLHPNRYK